jgi:hypothetical protein
VAIADQRNEGVPGSSPGVHRSRAKKATLSNLGAVCGVLTTVFFGIGIGFSIAGGVQTIIPGLGKDGLTWISDVHDAGGLFYISGWFVIIGGTFGLIALIGFFEPLRTAHPLMILAPVLTVVGFTLVQISHLIPLGLAYELVPGYVDADAATKASLTVDFHTFTAVALVLNYTGDILLWGVVVPMYAWAALKTAAVPRWIGWLGLVTAFFAGWVGALSPASSVIDGLTFIGFVGFFVWIAAMGVALIRRRERTHEALTPSTH